MKSLYLSVLALLFTGTTTLAQATTVREGEAFQIEKPDGDFQHIRFPRKNIIIKRGGLAHMGQVDGLTVVVERVDRQNGRQVVVLRRQDGRKFFRNFKTVTAYWPEAMESGELIASN